MILPCLSTVTDIGEKDDSCTKVDYKSKIQPVEITEDTDSSKILSSVLSCITLMQIPHCIYTINSCTRYIKIKMRTTDLDRSSSNPGLKMKIKP